MLEEDYSKYRGLEGVLKGKKLITRVTNRMSSGQLNINNGQNKPSFKGENAEVKEKRKDIYSTMPVRALGYTNELGEAIRPLSPLLANLSWLPAIGYISADVADKYRQDEYSNQSKSKGRASKQLSNQLLASVFLPTLAVKAGQAIVNNGASFGKTGLNLNHREQISDVVINSMKAGEHKNFLNPDGRVNVEEYKKSLGAKFDEIIKHKKTHKSMMRPVEVVLDFIKKPFIKKPSTEDVKKYAGGVVDRLVNERQQLLDGIKPKNMSYKAFKKLGEITKDMAQSEKQSIVFDSVRKLEKGRMFNNRILKSIGGLVSLAAMAKPIDKFVETVIVDKYVGPQIDYMSAVYYRQLEEQRQRKERLAQGIGVNNEINNEVNNGVNENGIHLPIEFSEKELEVKPEIQAEVSEIKPVEPEQVSAEQTEVKLAEAGQTQELQTEG